MSSAMVEYFDDFWWLHPGLADCVWCMRCSCCSLIEMVRTVRYCVAVEHGSDLFQCCGVICPLLLECVHDFPLPTASFLHSKKYAWNIFCCIRILHEQPLLGNWSQRQFVWDIDTWYGMSRHEPQLSLAVCRIQSNIAWSHDSTLLVTVPKDGIHVINQLKPIHHKWYKLIMSVGFMIWYQVWKILYTVIY